MDWSDEVAEILCELVCLCGCVWVRGEAVDSSLGRELGGNCRTVVIWKDAFWLVVGGGKPIQGIDWQFWGNWGPGEKLNALLSTTLWVSFVWLEWKLGDPSLVGSKWDRQPKTIKTLCIDLVGTNLLEVVQPKSGLIELEYLPGSSFCVGDATTTTTLSLEGLEFLVA